MENSIEKLLKIENGFKPIEAEAKMLIEAKPWVELKSLASALLHHQAYQIRSLAVFLFGHFAATDSGALHILQTHVSKDPSWQVQEILAKAFDQYCKDTTYERALPTIENWLAHPNPNVCRAVTEGLRIWTSRPFFNRNPKLAIDLIAQHRSHECQYLRKSVGNALRDISKKHGALIDAEISTWDLDNPRILFTHKLLTKTKLPPK